MSNKRGQELVNPITEEKEEPDGPSSSNIHRSSIPNLHRSVLHIKMLMLGNISVGKTNIMMRFSKGKFGTKYSPTIGIDFQLKNASIEGKKVQIQIWDTSGQERFRSLTSNYYRDANAVFLVFDITNEVSFSSITQWLEEVRQNAPSSIILVLVGNKSDLAASRTVSYESAAEYARSLGIKYFEVSAKLNANIDEAFYGTAMDVYYQYFPEALMKRKDTIEIVGEEKRKSRRKPKSQSYSCC